MRIPRLSVLGPISATIDGQDIELGGRRQRAVLAALVLSSPRVVDADDLLTRAWPADSPPNKATLHFYISKLRAALEPDRPRTAAAQVLIRRGPGYALILPPDAIDAVEFDRLLASAAAASAAGRWVEAVTMFTAAQALWRGRPYAEVADLPWIQPEIARLDELRLAAGEDLLDALLHAGRAAEVVGPAQQATARHPLRERGWELLATALYRTGRQAEALAALRTVRGVLADELGIDPGPGLIAVEQAVLAQVPIPPATPTVLDSVPAATLPSSAVPPLPLTGLVGRVNDVAGVEALLASGRLVTLTGPGGVGKTRLAMEVVRRQSSQPAGPGSETVHWVELAGLVDQTLLAVTVAASLGIPGVRDAQGLAAVLSGQRLLLVLDNAEQLIDAVAELVPLLLSRSRGLRILLTSRETVDVPGELIWEVQPLDPPTDAVRLFVARATAALPNWVPDAAESIAIERICVELDGLPLALELAAARMRVLSAAQLADGLRDRFALLGGGNRGMAAHQQDLAQLVEWSCRSLDPAELALFRVLAVFANGFDLDGAAAVSAGSPSGTLPLLNGLLRRSLLSAIPASTPRRYRMLETVRQWAITHSSTAERAQAEALHRTYILQRAQLAEAEIRGPSSDTAIARLQLDGPEHRVVFASTDRESALALAGALGWFWYRIGAIEEGLRHTRRALGITGTHWNDVDLVGEAANDEARLRRAAALIGLGGLTYLSGEPAAAAAALDAAGRLAAQADDPPTAARATAWRAHMLSFTNTPAQAVEQAQQSMTMARQAGVDWVTAEAMMILGMALRSARRPADNTGVAYDDDDGPRPRVVLAEAVSIAERAGHRWAATSSTWALMKAAMDDGDYAAALAAAGRMQDALESDGDVTSWLVLVHSTAAALAATGSADAAARLLGAVRTLGAGIGFDPGRMDPVDGPREVQAVRDALSAADFDRQVAVGAAMNRAEVTLELRELLQRTIKP